jgi:hypothetical protein
MCYNKQINVQVFGHVFPLITRFICQTIVDCLNPVVFTCVLNQSTIYWLLLDALNYAITMSSKAKDEMHLKPYFESFMDDDIGFFFELTTLPLKPQRKL